MVLDGQQCPSRSTRQERSASRAAFEDPFRSPARPIASPLPHSSPRQGHRTFSLNDTLPQLGTNVRGRYFDLSDPRRDTLPHISLHNLERRLTDPRRPDHPNVENWIERKPICVHCWETSGFCDFSAQCGTCKVDDVDCIRRLCSAGLYCTNTRCPCLHPGEWDENDKSWHVESGRLPPKKSKQILDPRTTKRAGSPIEGDAGPIRKPCCERCWKTGKWCHGGPRCGNCISAVKAKCAYRLCRWGLDCRSPRCVYIHPGQYDEADDRWTVEAGDIGVKGAWR
ncbi:hypothetical protein DOTSEDRAFT_69833 [Dothistroma septosporum NZE10]|uniref:Uncharacterized protein n=1 Tax=Dothistroma septosporum (strain NZE10 / CBS 128990) TaxID=675120 RepID=N1PWX2_DOTSN|nr:hypothetical protein DOTSEDRAFT_69833 [Dothistroma septosporum NZE10]